MPAVVALKVAAQYQPNWGTVRDFLAPNGYWHPKLLRRQRIPQDPGAAVPAQGSDSVATRGS